MLAGRAWRGRRVGSALVAAAIDGARSHGLDKLCLEVFAHNMAAITLYRKSGFLEEGRRTRQYPAGQRRAAGLRCHGAGPVAGSTPMNRQLAWGEQGRTRLPGFGDRAPQH